MVNASSDLAFSLSSWYHFMNRYLHFNGDTLWCSCPFLLFVQLCLWFAYALNIWHNSLIMWLRPWVFFVGNIALKKWKTGAIGWFIQLRVWLLILAQVMISWCWYWVLHWTLRWAWSLLKILSLYPPAPLPHSCSLSPCLSFLKKKKDSLLLSLPLPCSHAPSLFSLNKQSEGLFRFFHLFLCQPWLSICTFLSEC